MKMKMKMKMMLRALTAETLKMKRTLALWLAFVAPLAVVFYITAVFLGRRRTIL